MCAGTTASPSRPRTSSSRSTWCARRRTPPPSSASIRERSGTATSRPSRRRIPTPWCSASSVRSPPSSPCSPPRPPPQPPPPPTLPMLASGYSPVLPAHVPPAEHRNRCIGTGPFKFKEWKRGESVELVKNPDYFVKGRPYLHAIRYVVIVERGTRVAALQANQVDVAYPGETTLNIYEQLKAAVPKMVFTETASNVNENILINTTRPPFDNIKVRRALALAVDRRAYVQAVHRGSAIVGASLAPKPWGV